MSSNRSASASRLLSTPTQREITQSSDSDSDIPLAKMADSETLLADARQRVANLEKEERLLKLRREKDEIDSKARKVKEELERAEKALRKENSNTDRATQSDSATQEPPKKKPRLDGPRRSHGDETAPATDAEQKEDITGYEDLEALRIGPCNSCRESNNECIRSRRTTKNGTVELGRCSSCQTHHHSCVWGVGGYVRFRPRQSITETKEPRKRVPPKVKIVVKGPAAVEKSAEIKPAASGTKGKPLASDLQGIRNEMIEMHSKTMRAIEDLTRRVVALETQRAASGKGPGPQGAQH